MAGVAVATLAIVCVLSVFNGFAQLSAGRLALLDPPLRVERTDLRPIPQGDSVANVIASLSGVRGAVPVLSRRALAVCGDVQMPVILKGIPEGYDTLSTLPATVIDGTYALRDDNDRPAAMLGVGPAINLVAHPGKPVIFYAPRRVGRVNPANPMTAFRADSMLVAGVWQIDQPEYDTETVFVPLQRARSLFGYNEAEATAIEITPADGASVYDLRRSIQRILGPDYNILTRLQQQSEAFRMISVEKWITFLMLAFILLIAAFNIVSTLSMLIIEKRDNLRTLQYLGATSTTVSRIFVWEGWLISMLGGAIGMVLGVGLSLLQQYGHIIKLGGDPGRLSIDAYPVRVLPADLLTVALLVAVVGLAVGAIAGRLARR